MLKIKHNIFFDEKLTWNKESGNYIVQKRKLNVGKKPNGRIPEGEVKYQLIIQKQVLVEYDNSVVRKETRCLNWKTLSRFVRDRDKKCVKCGSTKELEADHFHPACYKWINWFFRANKVQTLCRKCHIKLPSMKVRANNWQKYCWLTPNG